MAKYRRTQCNLTGEYKGVYCPEIGYIPEDPYNKDYQEYLKWLEEGNTPD